MTNLILMAGYISIIWIALGACVIALIVFLLRKFVPGLKGDEKEEINQDDKEIASENVQARLSSLEDEKKENEEDE
jgi:ammonia channel protein AmtB